MSRIKIELEKVLKERKISKNQLCYACKLQHTQLNNYCKNKVVRVDLATIAKICDYVGCSIADILVLEKDEEPETGNAFRGIFFPDRLAFSSGLSYFK